MLNRSYLTSHQIEQQRLSSPSAPERPHPTGRHIPLELRAPAPSSDHLSGLERDTLLEQEMPAVVEEEEGDVTLIGTQQEAADGAAQQGEASSSVNISVAPAAGPSRSRSSLIGRALFPPPQGSPHYKRQSLPLPSTISSGSSVSSFSFASSSSLHTKRTSLPSASSSGSLSQTSSRKSTSPSHATGRRVLSSSLPASSSTAGRDGTLLALPLAKQLHELKTRNASLSKSLAAQQADANLKLAKAAERIKQLEEQQVEGKTDAEGWEAEAQRLAAELAAASTEALPAPGAARTDPATAEREADLTARVSLLERQLMAESAKRRRAKEMQAKLRCELVNRRWKEKWEIELLEREERRWEIKVVEAEAELTTVRWQMECEKAEREELQETLEVANKRISSLAAARKMLLDSFATSERTISSLRSDLAASRRELDEAVGTAQALQQEILQLKSELEDGKAAILRLEKGDKKSEEAKNKEAEKEKTKREKLEGEIKELKAQLKTVATSLKAAEEAASASSATAEEAQSALAALQASATAAAQKDRELLARSSSTVKAGTSTSASSGSRKRPAPVDEDDEAHEPEEAEEHPYATASPAPVKQAAVKARKPRAPKKVVAEPEPVDEEASASDAEVERELEATPVVVEDEEETYKPVKSKSRSAPVPSNKLKVKKDAPVKAAGGKKAKAALEEEEEEEEEVEEQGEEERTPRPTKSKAAAAKEKQEKVKEKPVVVAVEEQDKPASKKRKASVLGDKCANASRESLALSTSAGGEGAVGGQLKVKKKPAEKKKKLVLSEDEDEGDAAPVMAAKKKQKIKLFGGAKKKFEWTGVENANLDSGIPIDLSPIKLAAPKKVSLLGGLGGKKRASIFS
ncbi:hypothetical protein JCM11641_008026 [Rhodosporidiobolus odoratus]